MLKKILNLYNQHKEVILYLIFGVLTTVVSLAVKYSLLFTVLEADNAFQLQLAVIISWIAAVLFAYFTNRAYVFESKTENKLKEFINFVIARLVTLFLDMFIMWFFVTLLGLNSNLYIVIFTLVSQVVIIIMNYVLSKLFVFKDK